MNDMSYILNSLISAVATGILTFVFTRRKYRAETKGNEIDNVEKAVRIWRELSQELKKQFETDISRLQAENNLIREKLDNVLKENNNLKEQMESLEKQLKKTTAENQKLLTQLEKSNNSCALK